MRRVSRGAKSSDGEGHGIGGRPGRFRIREGLSREREASSNSSLRRPWGGKLAATAERSELLDTKFLGVANADAVLRVGARAARTGIHQ